MNLPKNTIDLAGQTFGRLTALEYVGREPAPANGRGGHAIWRCACSCGNECMIRGASLRAGRVVSCGCARADATIRQAARLQTPPRRRRAIARLGGAARASKIKPSPNSRP